MFRPPHIVWQRLRRQTKDTVHNNSMVHEDIYMYYLCKDIIHNIIYNYVCLSHGCTAWLLCMRPNLRQNLLTQKLVVGFETIWLVNSDEFMMRTSFILNNVLCDIHFLAGGPNFISDLNSEWVTSVSMWLWGQYIQMLYIDIGVEVLVHCGSLMIQTFQTRWPI